MLLSTASDHAVGDIASKISIFLPFRAIYFRSYQYETPCRTDACDVEKYITTALGQLFCVTDVSRLLRLEFFNYHPNLHLKTVFDADQAMTPLIYKSTLFKDGTFLTFPVCF